MAVASKTEADAYDRVIEAAAALAELIELNGIKLDEYDLEELTIHLARHSLDLRKILASALRPGANPQMDICPHAPSPE